MAYQHIFFDLDHTLWDFEHNTNETLSELYLKYNLNSYAKIPVEGFLYSFHGINNQLWDLYSKGKIGQADLRRKRFKLLFESFEGFEEVEKFADEYLNTCPNKPHLISYSIEVLDYLKNKNYHLHIITNGFSDTQYTKLESGKIRHYFDKVFTSGISGFKKPDVQMFEYALAISEAERHNSLMIGDTIESDIIGAQSAGIDTVYFNPKSLAHSSIPTFEIKSLRDLKVIL